MAFNKDIPCPHCKKAIPLGSGWFPHDKDLNFICPLCGKIVFGTNQQAEDIVKRVATGCGAGYTTPKKEPLAIRIPTDPLTAVAQPQPTPEVTITSPVTTPPSIFGAGEDFLGFA
jgi:hypothetical protein